MEHTSRPIVPSALSRFVALMLLSIIMGLATEPALAGLKVYYLRHAEAGHNVVRQWKDIPKSQWPAYVGNGNMLTPKGEEQAASIPEKLAPYHFDYIACSPIWRCRQTILPYLKKNERTADIWPLLEEFSSYQGQRTDRAPSKHLFDGGDVLKLPDEEQHWFVLPKEETHRIKIVSASDDREQHVADVHAVVDRLAATIRQRFAGTDQTILLVGHGNNGRLLMSALTGEKDRGEPKNISLWMAEEQPDGTFALRLFNDEPVNPQAEQQKNHQSPEPAGSK